MTGGSLRWDGLDELKEWLRTLPEHLTEEAAGIVTRAAVNAAEDIRAAYPVRTGNLRRGVRVNRIDGSNPLASGGGGRHLAVGAVVYNNAPHAFMFEHGTEARQTDLGANRGSMPAGHVFIPRVIRHRRHMYDQLRALMERSGLRTTGNAA